MSYSAQGPFHRRLRGHEDFDRVEFKIVPLLWYGHSSGDDWGHEVHATFWFKGAVTCILVFSDMRSAFMSAWVGYKSSTAPFVPRGLVEGELALCDQPGCSNPATSKFRIKRVTSREGELLDPALQRPTYFRKFCAEHVTRGERDLEDCDSNYVPLEPLRVKASRRLVVSAAPEGCNACMGNVGEGQVCYRCGLKGPAGQGRDPIDVPRREP